ncbi:MAG TPA: malto-oligosyltrehalose trehalohydrolase [Acetobacteraceae bacterium]|nr:malto-oligosyltrehalose trehalohydrolase [Acetobacteraceae bacterium]
MAAPRADAAGGFAYETRFGAVMLEGGATKFTFWAPGCDSVRLEIEGAEPVPMRRDEAGIFTAEAKLGAGARYKYRISNDLAVPDPVSRLQAKDVHDASVVVDPRAYHWRNASWRGRPWHEAVVLEVHAGAMGGFAGIMKELPRLKRLGITAIELMPIADFPGRHNWGYDGALPYAPDAAYGTPEQLKQLIDAAHDLELMVFLDVVYNHFGPDGNYLSAYAPGFFREDVPTPWGVAIDFRKPEVRRFFIDNALYWLMEYRFDGLRFDAVHAIEDPTFLMDMAKAIRAGVERDRHVHLVLENDDNAAALLRAGPDQDGYDAQWADDTHHCFHVLLTGEHEGYYEDYPKAAAQLARCLSEGFAYQGEPSQHRDGEPRGEKSAHLPPSDFVIFLQNHDQIGNRAFGDRLSTLADPAALRAATLVLLLSPQIPLLFMGQEWGEKRPFLYFTDHQNPDLAEAVRKGRRKEFEKFPAFSSAEKREKIPDPNARESFENSVPRLADPPDEDQSGWLSLHESLLRIRRDRIMSGIPGSRSLGASALGDAGIIASWRLGDGAVLTIAANFGASPVAIPAVEGEMLASTPENLRLSGSLPPRSAAAWLKAP